MIISLVRSQVTPLTRIKYKNTGWGSR